MSEVATNDLFAELLELCREMIESREKLTDFMQTASEQIQQQQNPYRVAAIMQSTARQVREANNRQRDRVESMLSIVQERERLNKRG